MRCDVPGFGGLTRLASNSGKGFGACSAPTELAMNVKTTAAPATIERHKGMEWPVCLSMSLLFFPKDSTKWRFKSSLKPQNLAYSPYFTDDAAQMPRQFTNRKRFLRALSLP
jgi:hypothetical protein